MSACSDNGGPVRSIALLSTGGTIEKTYDPLHGVLTNELSVLEVMLGGLRLQGVQLSPVPVMQKDSLDMTDEDHASIADSAIRAAEGRDGVVILHGTDRLARTGETLVEMTDGSPDVPIILTGAMVPWVLKNTDAMQNLTESLLAVQLLDPGVYVCMHNQVLRFPGVVKDRKNLRFVSTSSSDREEG